MKKREKDKYSAKRMTDIGRIATYGSLGLIALMAFVMLFPTTNNSHAAIEDEFSSNVHTDIKSYVRSTIALSITGQVNLDLTPKSSGTFSAETAKLSVSTNNVSGYSVYLAMVDGSSNSLLPMNTRSEEEIKATPETMTAENYTSFLNTWGYMVGGGAGYKAVPTAASTPIITESSSTKEASYDLSFAVAVGTDLPAGIYGNQVLVSTVANPIEVRGINDITYMQEMTSDICTVSFENETKQLIDTRDGKSYWVAKLKDGNCWMVQNLALDITEAGLKASDTDISEDWNQNSTYPPSKTNAVAFLGQPVEAKPTDTNSWDLGEFVLGISDHKDTLCGGRETNGAEFSYNSLISTDDVAARCSRATFVDVSGSEWKPTFVAENGTMTLSNGKTFSGNMTVDLQNHTYDAHYLIGNFYQFNAATAGGAKGEGEYSVASSICPKGWQLPVYEPVFETVKDKSVNHLLSMYGFKPQGSVLVGEYHISRAPFDYVKSGIVDLSVGYLTTFGVNAKLWTDYSMGSAQARENFFNMNNVYFGNNAAKTNGQSVRCVAR